MTNQYVPRPGCLAASSWGNAYDGSTARYRVKCECGFLVTNLSSAEAAEDTYRWHKGLSSTLGERESAHFLSKRRFQYQLVDQRGYDWPEIFLDLDGALSDLKYVKETYPQNTWTIRMREVSEWSTYQMEDD